MVVKGLSDQQFARTFPDLGRGGAEIRVRRERREFLARDDRASIYERDAREAQEHLDQGVFPEKVLVRIGKFGFYFSACTMTVLLFGGVSIATIGNAMGSDNEWVNVWVDVFFVFLLIPWPLAALWALGTRILHSRQRRRIVNWAVDRPDQLVRGLVNYPIPEEGGYKMITVPCHGLFGLSLFFTGLTLFHAVTDTFDGYSGATWGWIGFAVAFAISAVLWIVPRIQRRRYENQVAFALAMQPCDEDAQKVAEELGVEGL